MVPDGQADSRAGAIIRGRPGRVLLELLAVTGAAVREGIPMIRVPNASLLNRDYAVEVAAPLDHAALQFQDLPH